MEVKLHEITVRELVENYSDHAEEGVFGYNNRLDIRPPYQREFIYNDTQRALVIDTLMKGFPLNVMYWSVKDDGNFEIIDGQQRTISICQYVHGDFSFQDRFFHNLQQDEQEQILNYRLTIYLCTGTDSEKLKWFETINIAGEVLTKQELLNAIYSGPWVTDAKRFFSKRNSPAYGIANQYLSGVAIRQDYLETALMWISNRDGIDLKEYMARHQHDPNANALWRYFREVIEWVQLTFPVYRREMKGIAWGDFYNEHKDRTLDSNKLEKQISLLMMDDDVTSKKGIYRYVLDGNERYLNIRAFTPNQKREAYERQKGRCPVCKEVFELSEMEADHITPWSQGGKTESSNCQLLCREDNRRKSDI